ncbi:MAG TPA: hypothetical protein VI386_02630, partial [Candidatus Sulfotelmatobacter sp.]
MTPTAYILVLIQTATFGDTSSALSPGKNGALPWPSSPVNKAYWTASCSVVYSRAALVSHLASR